MTIFQEAQSKIDTEEKLKKNIIRLETVKREAPDLIAVLKSGLFSAAELTALKAQLQSVSDLHTDIGPYKDELDKAVSYTHLTLPTIYSV